MVTIIASASTGYLAEIDLRLPRWVFSTVMLGPVVVGLLIGRGDIAPLVPVRRRMGHRAVQPRFPRQRGSMAARAREMSAGRFAAASPPAVDTPPVPLAASPWRDDTDGVRPVVLVLGGFMTSPPVYRRLAARLRRRGVVDVVVAPVWTPDWLLVTVHGMGAIVTRAGRALLRAGDLAAASGASRGAPVLVVGHSAGGVTARLLTSPEPFEGRRLAAAGRIGAIITLGSPHHVAEDGDIGSQIGSAAAVFTDRVVPGATFAPRVGYVSVSTRGVVGRLDGESRARTAHRFYRGLLGAAADERPAIEGDGLVPVESALLDGATQIVLDDTTHGPSFGAPWYCSDERIDLWWPAALEAWQQALRARVTAAGEHEAMAGV